MAENSTCTGLYYEFYVHFKNFRQNPSKYAILAYAILASDCIEFLFNCSMVQSISISDEHLLVLTEKNEVYSCGMNVCGKKDPHNKEINETPTVIEELRGYKVTQISAGSSYSLVIYET